MRLHARHGMERLERSRLENVSKIDRVRDENVRKANRRIVGPVDRHNDVQRVDDVDDRRRKRGRRKWLQLNHALHCPRLSGLDDRDHILAARLVAELARMAARRRVDLPRALQGEGDLVDLGLAVRVVDGAFAENLVAIESDDRLVHREAHVDETARHAAAARHVLAAIFCPEARLLPRHDRHGNEQNHGEILRLGHSAGEVRRLHFCAQDVADLALLVADAGNGVWGEDEGALERLGRAGGSVVGHGDVHVDEYGRFAMGSVIRVGSPVLARAGRSRVARLPHLE